MSNILYHGSSEQNLEVLIPKGGNYKESCVYAVSEEAFAVIFIHRIGGSLLASWGRLKNGTPYFCERLDGVFEENYSNREGSIYVVDKKYFNREQDFWEEEFISKQKIRPVREIKILDLKKHLFRLESEDKLKIILFKDRKRYLPEIDDELLKIVKRLIGKYGYDKISKDLKKYRPEILDLIEVEQNLEE